MSDTFNVGDPVRFLPSYLKDLELDQREGMVTAVGQGLWGGAVRVDWGGEHGEVNHDPKYLVRAPREVT